MKEAGKYVALVLLFIAALVAAVPETVLAAHSPYGQQDVVWVRGKDYQGNNQGCEFAMNYNPYCVGLRMYSTNHAHQRNWDCEDFILDKVTNEICPGFNVGGLAMHWKGAPFDDEDYVGHVSVGMDYWPGEVGDIWVCPSDILSPSDEICDGKDNNCDGQIDEGGVCDPKGYFDAASCTELRGWTCDPSDWTADLSVHIYDEAGYVGATTANINREAAVGVACGNGDSAHGFSIAPFPALIDGTQKNLRAYGINVGAGTNKQLIGEHSITCSLAPDDCDTYGPGVSGFGECMIDAAPHGTPAEPIYCANPAGSCNGDTANCDDGGWFANSWGGTNTCCTTDADCDAATPICDGTTALCCDANWGQPCGMNACGVETGTYNCAGSCIGGGQDPPWLGVACGSDVGVCSEGIRDCANVCQGDVGPTESPESSCDGLDNDCDGSVDEGGVCGVCTPFATQNRGCGSDVGVCVSGSETRTCAADGLSWSGYVGCSATGPTESPESSCDGLDNDCDGSVDEGGVCGVCTPFATQNRGCGSDVGVCVSGSETRTCAADGLSWSGYVGCSATGPTESPESSCDGLDNDCDGSVDEGGVCGVCTPFATQNRGCGSDVGVCVSGSETRTCAADGLSWSGYVGCSATGPTESPESSCDGLDNDCDGSVDEGITDQTQPCGTNTGECTVGTQSRSCSAGSWSGWGACGGAYVGPVAEMCNGLDDDCDGSLDTDENPGSTGTEVCNGADDDCDGLIDETCTCTPSDTENQACGTNEGACTMGTQMRTCDATGAWGSWGACGGAYVGPSAENLACGNSVDDDCDTFTDEQDSDCPITLTINPDPAAPAVPITASWIANDGSLYPGTYRICDWLGCDVGGTCVNTESCQGATNCAIGTAPVTAGSYNYFLCFGENSDVEQLAVVGSCTPLATQNRGCGSDVGVCVSGIETRTCDATGSWGPYLGCTATGPTEDPEVTCDTLDNDCDGSIDEGGICALPPSDVIISVTNPVPGERITYTISSTGFTDSVNIIPATHTFVDISSGFYIASALSSGGAYAQEAFTHSPPADSVITLTLEDVYCGADCTNAFGVCDYTCYESGSCSFDMGPAPPGLGYWAGEMATFTDADELSLALRARCDAATPGDRRTVPGEPGFYFVCCGEVALPSPVEQLPIQPSSVEGCPDTIIKTVAVQRNYDSRLLTLNILTWDACDN